MVASYVVLAVGTGVVVIVVAIALVLIVAFVTGSMRGRQKRAEKRVTQLREAGDAGEQRAERRRDRETARGRRDDSPGR